MVAWDSHTAQWAQKVNDPLDMVSAHIKWIICGPSLAHKDKKTPLVNLEEELMMETWRLLKRDKEGLLHLPGYPLIINL